MKTKTYKVYRNEVLVATIRSNKPERAMLDAMNVYDWNMVQGVRGEWKVSK